MAKDKQQSVGQEDAKPEETVSAKGNNDDTGDTGKEGNKDTGSDRAHKEEAKTKAKKTKVATIRFALSKKQLMWSTPSRSIELSSFTQTTGAEIPIDHPDYPRVERAIDMGILEVLKGEETYPKFKSKDITYGKVEEDEKTKVTYNTKEYLDMLQEDVITKIQDITDPKLIIRLIQEERKGKNKEGATRQNVVSSLRAKLQGLNINGVYDIELGDL